LDLITGVDDGEGVIESCREPEEGNCREHETGLQGSRA
jgi:hypothetical protein